jgi:hypothetical protein
MIYPSWRSCVSTIERRFNRFIANAEEFDTGIATDCAARVVDLTSDS